MKTDPHKMDKRSKTIFKDVYLQIADQIIRRCGIKKGTCIDVGSGPGALAVALSKVTDLNIYSLDISAQMNEIAKKNIVEEGLQYRIFPVKGDVCKLPFPNGFADLVISRGSIFFWENKETAFREICRVLKPGGWAYIGGGFGSKTLKNKIRQSVNTGRTDHISIPKISITGLKLILNRVPIKDYHLLNDNSGLWILFKK